MKKKGFTLLEVLLAIGIIVLIVVLLNSALSEFFVTSRLTEAHTNITGLLRDARARTLASESKTTYGVHFDQSTSQAVLFQGSSYSSGAAGNEPYALPSGVAFSSINLGGPVDIIFQRLTGYSLASGTIVLQTRRESSKRATTTILGTGAICAGTSC